MNLNFLQRNSVEIDGLTALNKNIISILDDAKGEDIVTIDLMHKSPLADYMIIVTGRSQRHVVALANELLDKLSKVGVKNVKVEGLNLGNWILIDCGDVIIHIFQQEIRQFYNLEKMWCENHLTE